MFVGNRTQSVFVFAYNEVLLKKHGSQAFHTHVIIRVVHLPPAVLVFQRVQRGSNAGTLRRQRERKVVHRHMLQMALVAKQLIPRITEVGRTQLDVRGVWKKEDDCRDCSSVNR